jgi:hypothetical protein
MNLSALSQISETSLPASVRNGTAKDKEAYRAALGFEQVLLGTLVKSMATSGPLADGDYAAPVQEAFTSSIVNSGGLGLGAELYRSLKERA